MREIWKEIPGFDRYMVSSIGRVKRLARIDPLGRLWKERFVRSVYSGVYVTRDYDGIRVWQAIARLMLLAFMGPPPVGKYLSRHLDDNRENNTLSNIAWGDHQDNKDDALRNGIGYGYKHTLEFRKNLSRRMIGNTINTGRKNSPARRKQQGEASRIGWAKRKEKEEEERVK
jgi:hypothetical protein